MVLPTPLEPPIHLSVPGSSVRCPSRSVHRARGLRPCLSATSRAPRSSPVTKDIDAVFELKSAIYLAAAKVAEDLGLPEDWLNDAVKGFMPGEDEHARPVPDITGIEISTASPQYLLAMKLMAMRFGEDDEDIEILLRECDCTARRRRLIFSSTCTPTRSCRQRRVSSSRSSSDRCPHRDRGQPRGEEVSSCRSACVRLGGRG